MARPSSYPSELSKRAVRMVAEVRADYPNESAALRAVAQKLGTTGQHCVLHHHRRYRAEPGPAPMAPTPAGREVVGQYEVVTVAPLKAAAAWRLM